MTGTSYNIVGVYFGHNGSVALSRDGEIIFALSEERLSKKKNHVGFPEKAYAYMVNTYLKGDCQKIDQLVVPCGSNLEYDFYVEQGNFTDHQYYKAYSSGTVPEVPELFRLRNRDYFREYLIKDLKAVGRLDRDAEVKKRFRAYLEEKTGLGSEKFIYLDHHKAHAYSTLYYSGQEDERIVFTLDGSGDNRCASVSLLTEAGVLKRVSRTTRYPSPGRFYREITAFLGMRPDEHEYKVMGLAPYAYEAEVGRIKAKFKDILWLADDGRFRSQFSMELVRYFLLSECAYDRFDCVAGAAQAFIEELVCEWVTYWAEKLGIWNLSFAGGVFMNVKLNQAISNIKGIKSIVITPAASDESLVVGCCAYGNLLKGGVSLRPVSTGSLGVSVNEEEVKSYFEENGTKYSYLVIHSEDPHQEVAALLASGEVVGWVSGRCEWGPRALGNRSLIADPARAGVVKKINQMIKKRDFWMPFAPSIIDSDVARYTREVGPQLDMRWMTVAQDVTERALSDLPAALHPADNTSRVQMVTEDTNSDFYTLLLKFREITGRGALLNTSLNLHGSPIATDVADCIHIMEHSDLEYLRIGSLIIRKE